MAGEAPAIDDVAVEHQFLAVGVLEEVVDLVDLAIFGAQVHVREDDRFVGKSRFFHSDLS